jgi:PAS domain S-box-containing protein
MLASVVADFQVANENTRLTIDHTRAVLVVTLGLAIAIGLGFGFVVSYNITNPIRSLTQVVRLVSAGDLDQRAPVTTGDEIGELSQAFNRMTARIQAQSEELARLFEQTQAALEERLRTVVSNAPVVLFALDSEGVFTLVEGRGLEALDLEPSQLVGQSVFDLFRERPDILENVRRALTAEAFTSIVELDGAVFEAHWSPLRNGDDEATGITIVATDITERKRTQAEILRLQHLLQNIADSMPSVLVTLDPQGQVLTWNPAAEALTGKAVDQVQGQSLWQTCPELTRYRELFEEVLQEQRVVQRHKEQLATETGVSYRDVNVFPLETNDVEGAVLRIDDVTRRVQLEEMMLQSAKLASLGGLAAGVAHEINNPLGAMMQSAQVLQIALDVGRPRTRERLQACGVDPEGWKRYLQERELLEYLAGIRDAGGRAAKIVSDLLSFSHKPSSKVALHDLNALVEQTLELAATDYDLKKKYDFRNQELVREYTANLPKVVCDGQQIQQVVLNLVRNAAQAMAERAGREDRDADYQPRLTLRTSSSPGWVRLEIEDNGPGIPEGARERLFDPFFTTKEVGEGTGLGLWLSWSIIVERHGGRIWAEPVEARGTRFVVELPIGGPL